MDITESSFNRGRIYALLARLCFKPLDIRGKFPGIASGSGQGGLLSAGAGDRFFSSALPCWLAQPTINKEKISVVEKDSFIKAPF